MTPTVCFICLRAYGYFNPEVVFQGGGAERQIYLLSTALASDFDIHVIVADYGQPKREQREGVTLHRAYPLHERQNILQPVKHLAMLGEAMRRADADVYVHRAFLRAAGLSYLISRGLRARWAFNVANDSHISEDPGALPTPLRWLHRCAMSGADGIIAQTPTQKQGMEAEYDTDATVVPNGYPSADNPFTFTRRDRFLWVGRLDKNQKRPHLLLDIAEQVQSATFAIAGPTEGHGQYAQDILTRIDSLSNVEYLGVLDPDEIHQEYRRALALLNTSAHEGFPNTFLEAWRQGTPVVSLEVDPDRFLETGDPRLAAADDISTAAERCRRLADERGYWTELSEHSREAFEAKYTMSAVADRYADAIRKVLK